MTLPLTASKYLWQGTVCPFTYTQWESIGNTINTEAAAKDLGAIHDTVV